MSSLGGINNELTSIDDVKDPEEGRQQMLAYIRQLKITIQNQIKEKNDEDLIRYEEVRGLIDRLTVRV